MGFDKRDTAKTYTPADGDTLKSIADAEAAAGNPITWQDLARFNWGTADPKIADEKLRDELGCYVRGDDKKFVFSADAEVRTPLLIPKPYKKSGLSTTQTHTLKVKKQPEPPKQFLECASIDGSTFEFDKSFLRPSVADQLKPVDKAIQAHPDAKVLIFGHTDKVGTEQYNKKLSERRALSVYAFITNQPGIWEGLYNEEHWGIRVVQAILKDMGDPYDPGAVDGIEGEKTKKAVKQFQTDNGLTPDGNAGPKTRKVLFEKYMSGKHDIKIEDGQFMDPKHTGCGEFNPQVETEAQCEDNRRVTLYLFNPARLPNLPCKAVDIAPCKKQVKKPLPRYKPSFHCSFYDSLANECPCEGPAPKPDKKWPVALQGKLFWNRTWNYNDETEAFGPEKEYLPGAKAELRIQPKGAAALKVHGSVFLTDDGEFRFENVPEIDKAEVRISLEFRGSKIVCAKGKTFKGSDHPFIEADFEVRTGKFIWHQLPLDIAKVDGSAKLVDLGDIEIKKEHFVEICDAYKSVWYGHEQLKKLAEFDIGICQINYPEDPDVTVSNASEQMQLCRLDLKDRDVILHEYGHFIGFNVLKGLGNAGYDYNDEAGHNFDTKEHYESGWDEGHATFLACALQDDPHYHDGYDTNPKKKKGGGLNFHLDTDNTTLGPHCEGSIQEALWRIYKVHGTSFKDGFWRAFTDKSKRTVRTIFMFYDNWKDLKLASLDKVIEAYKKFNMEFGYTYPDSGDRFTAVAAPKVFDEAKKQFRTIDELHASFGSTGGGTLADYKEEFYNRNKFFNAGNLGAGSTRTNPKLVAGKKYIVPRRFQITA